MLVTDAFGGRGGIALYNSDLIKALCKNPDCKEVVAIPRLMPFVPETLPDKLIYVTTGTNSKLKYIKTVMGAIGERGKFNLIICGHINLLPVAFIAKLFLRVPVVLNIYGIDAWEPHRNIFVRHFLRKIKAVTSISEYTKNRFLSWVGIAQNRIYLLPNAIDMASYRPAPKNPGLIKRYGLHGKKVIMTMGRISASERYKGFDEIIELLPEVAAEVPEIVYMIVGDGDDRQRLDEKVRALNLENRVIFAGFIPEAEKADHFRLADAFIMPSRGEGFGFVFLEAMACGIPVVASAVDGSREAVREGELGILVDPDDAMSIKSGILKALQYENRNVPEGLEYFSVKNFEKRLRAILADVMSFNGGDQ